MTGSIWPYPLDEREPVGSTLPGARDSNPVAILIAPCQAALADRDLLLIDQRGTGRSGALRCNLYSAADPGTSLRELFPASAVRECASQLADLTQYGYAKFLLELQLHPVLRALT